jgi:hypothetical protein
MNRRAAPGPRDGDILLLNSDTSRGKQNKGAQSILLDRFVRYSHVALCVGLSLCIHADTASGVDFIDLKSLTETYSGEWRAIRHIEIAEIAARDLMSVQNAAQFYLGMPYLSDWRKFVGDTPIEAETFCSMFIRDVFGHLGINLFPGVTRPLPGHFQYLPEHELGVWTDVTAEHDYGRRVLAKYPSLDEQAVAMCASARRVRASQRDSLEMYALLQKWHQVGVKFDEMLGVPSPPDFPDPILTIDYWDQKK